MLSPLVRSFDPARHPQLLAGLGTPDDAAVYRLNARTAVVATVDFFAPLVDDPWRYGAIAAANAMSDVYAMGGEVALALNVAAFPEDLPPETAAAIIRGGAEKVAEAGGVIAGGHTVWDDEPKYGLSVLGLVHPARLLRKDALRAGDRLYLTKPLGTGVILAATGGGGDSPWLEGAVDSMLRLNRHAAHLAVGHRLRAATDVTGFGLAGHLWEMVERSGVAARLEAAALPLLPGAREAAASGAHTGGEGRNRDWVGDRFAAGAGVPDELAAIAFDPQTSGGLLLACPARKVKALETAFAADGEPLWPIGRVLRGEPRIELR